MTKGLSPSMAKRVRRLRQKGLQEQDNSMDGKRRSRIRKNEARTIRELYSWLRRARDCSHRLAINTISYEIVRSPRTIEKCLKEAKRTGLVVAPVWQRIDLKAVPGVPTAYHHDLGRVPEIVIVTFADGEVRGPIYEVPGRRTKSQVVFTTDPLTSGPNAYAYLGIGIK